VRGAEQVVEVRLEAEACPIYSTAVLDLGQGTTPEEAQSFLRALEASPKRLPAVDASNELLHRYGHPTHAFDADRIRGAVSVRWARPGEQLVTLDGVTRSLLAQDLVIADEAGPIALAGVMGGDGTNDPTLMKTAGPAADGMIITTAPLAQFLAGAHDYLDQYNKSYGQGPGPYSVYEYDAVGVTAKAIADGKSAKPADISAALHKISNYPGATGTIGFNPKGDRSRAVYITIIVHNDQFEPYQRQDANGKWVAMK